MRRQRGPGVGPECHIIYSLGLTFVDSYSLFLLLPSQTPARK